ncbi:MAG: hypothetical protein MSA13_00975 [Prevotella sp.]|nr:hypothetical protein [Prevotella sp.]
MHIIGLNRLCPWIAHANLLSLSASYDIACPADVTLTPSVGFTPWQGYYNDKAAITDISLKASKDVALSDKISLPLFVQAIASPINDHVYLVAGVGIGF